MHGVIETATYRRRAALAGLGEDALTAIAEHYARNPAAGALMPGIGGARKLRFADRGFGKSGGHRAISYYAGPDVPVFLLLIYGKDEADSLTGAEKNALRSALATVASDYRAGVAARAGA